MQLYCVELVPEWGASTFVKIAADSPGNALDAVLGTDADCPGMAERTWDSTYLRVCVTLVD